MLRITIGMALMVAWSLGVGTVQNGWPDRSASWWVVYLSGFVVIGVVWYFVDRAIDRRREHQQ